MIILLLAATVRSFAHIPLGISDRNTVLDINNLDFLKLTIMLVL